MVPGIPRGVLGMWATTKQISRRMFDNRSADIGMDVVRNSNEDMTKYLVNTYRRQCTTHLFVNDRSYLNSRSTNHRKSIEHRSNSYRSESTKIAWPHTSNTFLKYIVIEFQCLFGKHRTCVVSRSIIMLHRLRYMFEMQLPITWHVYNVSLKSIQHFRRPLEIQSKLRSNLFRT